LHVPEGGTPPVITDLDGLRNCIATLSKGTGPIAIDAERASGFRYSSRAYLIQIFRRNGGLHLIDPIAVANTAVINELNDVISHSEVVIHASTQDLACLREFGIKPLLLFDTELGARIAGCARVGLGALCESLLGITLAKEHSAVDWSIRPLQQEWLDYAALDVAVLLDLRDKVYELLEQQGKLQWAQQDFDSILKAAPNPPRKDPWRRTSGMHEIKSRYQMAIIRELWIERDKIAAEIDLAPGRLLSDAVIIALAKSQVKSFADIMKLSEAKSRIRNDLQRSYVETWLKVFHHASSMPESEWPQLRSKSDALPPVKIWKVKFPLAYAHVSHAKRRLQMIADECSIPLENLISPELVRKISFDGGSEKFYDISSSLVKKVETQLRLNGAREWQIEKCAESLALSLCETEPPATPESPAESESPNGEAPEGEIHA
jgi:ribonuclease D